MEEKGVESALEEGVNLRVERGVNQGVKKNDKYIGIVKK